MCVYASVTLLHRLYSYSAVIYTLLIYVYHVHVHCIYAVLANVYTYIIFLYIICYIYTLYRAHREPSSDLTHARVCDTYAGILYCYYILEVLYSALTHLY